MPKTRHVVTTTLVVVVAVAALFIWRVVFAYVSARFTRPPAITISRETTYLTEPVREDGTIDYLAAINRQCSEGVTPENNASVLLWQALGPKACNSADPKKFFELLGMSAPPPEGDYFVSLEEWKKEHPATQGESSEIDPAESDQDKKEFDPGRPRPWTRNEFPQLAEWLDANEKPLTLVVEATRRPKRYDPKIVAEGQTLTLLVADTPHVGASFDLVRAFVASAMLNLSEGRTADAWQDLLALERLARLVARGRTLVEELSGAGMASTASQAERVILQSAQLGRDDLQRMRRDLDELEQLESSVDTIDHYERFALLDSICGLARESSRANSASKSSDRIDRRLLKAAGKSFLDWNLVLRTSNGWWDRLVTAYRIENRAEREAAVSAVNKSLAKTVKQAKRTAESLRSWLHPRQSVSDYVAFTLLEMFFPAIRTAPVVQDRAQMELDVTRLAFALAKFRVDHGAYPELLAELVPDYIKSVPNDIFVDAPLQYEATDGGYVLRSAGPKFPRDEFSEDAAEPVTDEDHSITVRMPG